MLRKVRPNFMIVRARRSALITSSGLQGLLLVLGHSRSASDGAEVIKESRARKNGAAFLALLT